MKRFLSTSLIALTLLIAAGAVPAARAQNVTCTIGGTDCGIGYTCQSDGQGGTSCVLTQAGSNNANSSAAAGTTGTTGSGQPTAAAAQTSAQGVVSTPDSTDAAYNTVMIKIMGLFAWLAGTAMTVLNYSMYYTVVTMGTYVSKLTAVGVAWRVLRDVGNIVLIFGFLAVGISTILNADSYGVKKRLPMLLIVAVFINFSLFASEAIIDFGNLFATQIYTQINGGSIPNVNTLSNGHGISDTILSQLGLTSIYGSLTNAANAKTILAGANQWFIGFMSVLLFLILAFVLFSLAFMLISRFVVLILLIIVAPVGFAGLVVPKLENTARDWWSTLFKQTITAPVLLLMLYIALAVITDANFLTGFGSSQGTQNGASWLGSVAGQVPGFAAVLLSFIVAMALLLFVVIIANRMSAFGASWATKTAGALSLGATAWAGRKSVGKISNVSSRAIRSSRLGRTEAGRYLLKATDYGAKASFDVRGSKAFGSAAKTGGFDAGSAQKGGYRAGEEASTKARVDHAKTILQTKSQKDTEKSANDQKAANEKTHKANMAPLEQREQELLREKRNISKEGAQKLEKLKDTLDNVKSNGTKAQIDAAQAEFDTEQKLHTARMDAAQEELDGVRNDISKEKARHAEANNDQDKIINANSAKANQTAYAESLANPKTKWGKFGLWATSTGRANQNASAAINKNANKTKEDLLTDALTAAASKAEKPEAAPEKKSDAH